MTIENTSGAREGLAEHITVQVDPKVHQTIEIKDDPIDYGENTGIPLSSAIRTIQTVIKATRPSDREQLCGYLRVVSMSSYFFPQGVLKENP